MFMEKGAEIMGGDLDVLYAIHQLTITFVTYIFKITSLTFLFFRRARKKSFVLKKLDTLHENRPPQVDFKTEHGHCNNL